MTTHIEEQGWKLMFLLLTTLQTLSHAVTILVCSLCAMRNIFIIKMHVRVHPAWNSVKGEFTSWLDTDYPEHTETECSQSTQMNQHSTHAQSALQKKLVSCWSFVSVKIVVSLRKTPLTMAWLSFHSGINEWLMVYHSCCSGTCWFWVVHHCRLWYGAAVLLACGALKVSLIFHITPLWLTVCWFFFFLCAHSPANSWYISDGYITVVPPADLPVVYESVWGGGVAYCFLVP